MDYLSIDSYMENEDDSDQIDNYNFYVPIEVHYDSFNQKKPEDYDTRSVAPNLDLYNQLYPDQSYMENKNRYGDDYYNY